MPEVSEPGAGVERDSRAAADAVYAELTARLGEGSPQRRLHATRRAVELLGDPHRAYPVIHLTGTNGKTSTSRMIESILRAHNLKTALFTSPHLVRFTERIVIDGAPISDEDVVRNWRDVAPYIEMIDAQLSAEGEQRLTFFEVLTVLAFACFADAAVDVAVIEVGMGGEWDSTNVADGQVAVFTPVSLDHTATLGSTVGEIARTKAGIIKDGADVVTAAQPPEALAEIEAAAAAHGGSVAAQPAAFDVVADAVAVGGQLVGVRGRAAVYDDLFLPLYGAHQAQNLAVAIAAVETFIGAGTRPITREVLEDGLARATSPGRLQQIGVDPTVLVDAAHNPAGARVLAAAMREYFDFDELAVVFGVMHDKDVRGIVRALEPIAARFEISRAHTARASDSVELAEAVAGWTSPDRVAEHAEVADALAAARAWAGRAPGRGVLVTGSIVLVGEALRVAQVEGWATTGAER